MSDPVTVRAPAKLNVFLRVLGRRDDGYHEIETLVLPLSLHDRVTVARDRRLFLDVRGDHAPLVPRDDQNLALRAAQALAARAGREPVARIVIEKRIPVAAGLGGGSADAAATLRALNELWGLGLGAEELLEVAAEVGSDVPALVAGGAVLARGRGERITPVHAVTTHWVIRPFGFGVSAAEAYGWWGADGDAATGPDPGALIAAVETGNDDLLGSALQNDLQPGVIARRPEIAQVIETLRDAGALGAIVSGSGPTVVALARHLGHADELAARVRGALVASGPPPGTVA